MDICGPMMVKSSFGQLQTTSSSSAATIMQPTSFFPSTSATSILMESVLAAQRRLTDNGNDGVETKMEIATPRDSPVNCFKMKNGWERTQSNVSFFHPYMSSSSATTSTPSPTDTIAAAAISIVTSSPPSPNYYHHQPHHHQPPPPPMVSSSTPTMAPQQQQQQCAKNDQMKANFESVDYQFDSSPASCWPMPRRGERCVGCGSSTAIRVHYGASSCHGCKAFFRRSVFEGRVYMCSAENNCDITNESRNRCRACRLRNCLDGGMNPKHVREERSKIERMPSSASCATTAVSANGMHATVGADATTSSSEAEGVERKPIQEHQLTLFMCALEKQTEMLTDDDVRNNDLMGAWSRDITLSFGLHNPQMVIKRLPLVYTCDKIMEANDLYFSWYRSFVFCADWAMGIPDFRILPLPDQTTLFKQNFMAFGWINFAYKCYEMNHQNIGIPLGNGAYIPYNDDEQKKMPERWATTYGVVCKKLVDLIVRVMIELQMSEEEYCLIKTISLFQLDCLLSPHGAAVVNKVRDRLLEALSIHIECKFPHLSPLERSTRAMKLTLMLPSFSHIGQVESTLIQQLTAADLHQLSGVPMEICAAQQTL
ncbi:unnamed protein product [Caenorhabditis bovis]|uniref:Uncharacterized protein n=1 Tax=Caenorhabditis bovis TaxID=2654633 RepID=A0A8S1EYH5_9PELO|nr:unnamed protein product [Caenorhabditis bovis]